MTAISRKNTVCCVHDGALHIESIIYAFIKGCEVLMVDISGFGHTGTVLCVIKQSKHLIRQTELILILEHYNTS